MAYPRTHSPKNNPGFYLSHSSQDSPKPSLLGGRPGWSTHSPPTSPLSPCKVTHTGGPWLLQAPKTGLKGPREKRDYAHCPRRKMWQHMRKDSKTVLSSSSYLATPGKADNGPPIGQPDGRALTTPKNTQHRTAVFSCFFSKEQTLTAETSCLFHHPPCPREVFVLHSLLWSR